MFGRIKIESPFDIVIIDPPSFQKGSFVATNDYIKDYKKLRFIYTKRKFDNMI